VSVASLKARMLSGRKRYGFPPSVRVFSFRLLSAVTGGFFDLASVQVQVDAAFLPFLLREPWGFLQDEIRIGRGH